MWGTIINQKQLDYGIKDKCSKETTSSLQQYRGKESETIHDLQTLIQVWRRMEM